MTEGTPWGTERDWERQVRALEEAQRGREARLIERLERLEATIAAATERLDEELRAHLGWHQILDARLDIFDAFQASAASRLAALTRQIEDVAGRIASVQGETIPQIATFQANIAPHLDALTRQGDYLSTEVERLTAEMRAIPYMSNPTALLTTDAAGRPVIGYRDGPPHDAAGYRTFEDLFRGAEAFIRERQRVYLPHLEGRQPVLDVGCGRGEFLDLLAEAGVPATGIDLDAEMVARSAAKGHTVERADLITYLEEQPDDTYGMIFCAQVIEHLSYDTLNAFLALAERTLKPGGVLIAETVNPHSFPAYKAFWVDLTHHAPIFPEVATVLCALHGFATAVVIFPNGSGDLDRDRWAQGEYAVIATKRAASSPDRSPV